MADESHFLELIDNTSTCGYNDEDETRPNSLTRAFVQKVEFPARNPRRDSAISVTFGLGNRSMTREEVQACLDEQNPKRPHRGVSFAPSVRSYHIDFLFDGHDYRPTPASAARMRALGL